ncbi:leucine-rich repeat domain-containing protein [Thalassoglobus polymorphus]|uniref:hypothetical protein n=1 Tax=Thalassoglobus polymorphus TaxID=2527994 RepID=UPI0011AA9E0D|nr:hypothetical protein [Thalassoglobus polymorphus]
MKLFIALIVIPQHGCQSRSPEKEVASQREDVATWDDLVQAVQSEVSTELRFTHEAVSSEQFLELPSLGEKLTVLEVDQGQLDNSDLSRVLQELPNLRQLVLHGDVDNQQLQVIADNAKSVTVLNLPNASVDDSGLSVLAAIETLELLRLHSPNVSDAGLAEIAKSPGLKFLHLINVPITDDGLKTIAMMEKLESFYLDGSACTEAGLSELVRKRPGLHFHWNQLHLENDPNKHPH